MIPIKMMQRQMPGSKVSSRHPVRNHLETMDSVEVVRTIREALKR